MTFNHIHCVYCSRVCAHTSILLQFVGIVQIDISPEFSLKLPFRICCVSLLVSLQVGTLTESERESVALLSAVSRTTAEVSSTTPLDATSLIVD